MRWGKTHHQWREERRGGRQCKERREKGLIGGGMKNKNGGWNDVGTFKSWGKEAPESLDDSIQRN